MTVTTLSEKGQIVLPKAIRESLGLRKGDRLALELDGERVVLTRLPTSREVDWRRWRGSLSGTRALQGHVEEHAEEVRRERLS